ncbi:glycosyltransferase family 4 protein [Oculatella sp. LEGE 06141]|uniref:glycosyltransferase family 4 protein n=1 Tax=Oculatella sp. LEGE 06141 TaxID=1828648 RepID=UPI0018807CEB|nr:glycosyltransferase family 4 protein [Oculatella sp. LEGE 06141]MBE9178837.1 glycosyltransferase family 4 protein [Oculatella sp. LEGE 06141]
MNPRVAWLLTSSKYYWHPALSEFARCFPQLTVFAPNWNGYALGYENGFAIETFAKPKIIPITRSATGYGSNFTYLPLTIISRLLRLRPQLIFANSFGIWTILSLLLKPLGQWRVVIAYEGSSPSVDYRHSPWRTAVRRWMVRAADACISNSQAGKAYLVDVLKAPADRVFAHPYQLAVPNSLGGLTTATELDLSHHHRPIFLFVGRIVPRKGLRQLLEACALLQQWGCDRYTLLIAGEGWQRSELEVFCQEHQLGDRVQWLGQVDYSQLGAYYRQSDVFVLPTLEDTWGVVILEAMAFGKPLLCSRDAGAAELMVDGENGYCFDPQQPEALAQKMQHLIHNPNLIAGMGQQSQKLIEPCTPELAAQFLSNVASFVLEEQR